jgi:hypothetical protein
LRTLLYNSHICNTVTSLFAHYARAGRGLCDQRAIIAGFAASGPG